MDEDLEETKVITDTILSLVASGTDPNRIISILLTNLIGYAQTYPEELRQQIYAACIYQISTRMIK